MAKFNFENYEQNHPNAGGNSGDFKVKFFKLGNGETRVLRFPYKSASEFDTIDVHTVQDGGKFRKVSCLRNAYEPIEKCPLCLAEKPVKSRFLAKVLYYDQDPTTGAMLPKAGVWDAPMSVAKDLRNFINEYGDLAGMIFKVTRTGDKLETKYSIIPANMAIYKEEIYPADFKDFEGLKMENRFYFDKTADEMNTYLTTGQFPAQVKAQSTNTGFVHQTPVQQMPQQQVVPPQGQVFTPQAAQSPAYLNEAVQSGANAFNRYVPPVVGVEAPITPEQLNAQANVVQSTTTGFQQPVTGRRYSY